MTHHLRSLIVAAVATALTATTVSAAVAATTHKTPPSTGMDWISLGQDHEFQPATANSDSPQKQRALRQAQLRFLEETTGQQATAQTFLDTTETYYAGNSQAWRYVGFYTDCSPSQDRRDRVRHLQEDGEEEPCTRYLLWAAYVDLSYEGNGIGEYQFYDTYNDEWDATACEATGRGISTDEDGTVSIDESQCKKMDCHLPDTNFQLMGYFKHYDYTDFFEQLFKHQSYCIWQQGEYDFMYNNYGAWPEGCSQVEDAYLSDGSSLYYDLKALPNATMAYGLYTDARCSVDYTGDEVTAESVLNGDEDMLSAENLEYWNDAMEIHRVCQPCRAYSLHSNNNDKRKLQDNDNNFQCDDAAGYTNVNQCMKFRTQTNLQFASLEEVLDAAQQGGITAVYAGGKQYGSYKTGINYEATIPNWNLMWIACGVLGAGILIIVAALLWTQSRLRSTRRQSLNQPLMGSDDL